MTYSAQLSSIHDGMEFIDYYSEFGGYRGGLMDAWHDQLGTEAVLGMMEQVGEDSRSYVTLRNSLACLTSQVYLVMRGLFK